MEKQRYGKPASYYKFVCFILLCKWCHLLGLYQKGRKNNSIFLISQLHTKPSLELCQTSMVKFFQKQLRTKLDLRWSETTYIIEI